MHEKLDIYNSCTHKFFLKPDVNCCLLVIVADTSYYFLLLVTKISGQMNSEMILLEDLNAFSLI